MEYDNQGQIRYADYKEELKLRMEMYPFHLDLLSLFKNAYEEHKDLFHQAVEKLGMPLFNEAGKFRNIQGITLGEVDEIARAFGKCGYEFLESGYLKKHHKFYTHIPIRYQPYLDELFEFAFQRELNTIQYCIDEFIEESHLNLEELNAIDIGEQEVTLSSGEKIAQGFYIPAFEMIQHEYILYVATKIKKYNPHRTFHRLSDLHETDKHKILDYIRYIIQGDSVVTSAELQFIDRLVPKLELVDLNMDEYKMQLFKEIYFHELEPLSTQLLEPIRRQVLGLVIDTAYADNLVNEDEGPRILEIAKLIMGDFE